MEQKSILFPDSHRSILGTSGEVREGGGFKYG